MYDNYGLDQAGDAYNYANAMHNMQGNYLGGMAGDVMSAFSKENDSRVAQSREQRRLEYQKWLAEQQLYLQWGKLNNEREMRKDAAAHQIRLLKAQMAAREDAQPSAWTQDARTGQMVPMSIPKAGQIRRRSFQEDPLTGERRWMEDWEL